MQRCMHAYTHYIIGYQCINMPDGGKYANFVLLKIFETINSSSFSSLYAIDLHYFISTFFGHYGHSGEQSSELFKH